MNLVRCIDAAMDGDELRPFGTKGLRAALMGSTAAPRELTSPPGIYRNRPATGVARVVCYSPRHDVTLAELDLDGVDALLETW